MTVFVQQACNNVLNNWNKMTKIWAKKKVFLQMTLTSLIDKPKCLASYFVIAKE